MTISLPTPGGNNDIWGTLLNNYLGVSTDSAGAITGSPGSLLPAAVGNFNVKSFGAKGDGATDDTTAIQKATTAACAGGGIVYFPPGTYMVSNPINCTASGVTFQGANRFSSVLKETSSFPYTATVSGINGNGIIQFVTGPTVFIGNGVYDLGFDNTLNAQAYTNSTTYNNIINAIYQSAVPVQHFNAQRLYFNLGANGQGILFDCLAAGGTSNPSYDITVRDIFAVNGAGTISCYGNVNTLASNYGYYSDVTIDNVWNWCSAPNLWDDRVAIVAGSLGKSSLPTTTTQNTVISGGQWAVNDATKLPSATTTSPGAFSVVTTGGSGSIIINYTGVSGNTLTGCSQVGGSGTVAVGAVVTPFLYSEVRNINISNIYVNVAPSSSGVCNGVKFDCGNQGGFIHDTEVKKIYFNSQTNMTSNNPYIAVLGTSGVGTMENMLLDGVHAVNSQSVQVRFARNSWSTTNVAPFVTVKNVHITNCQDTRGIEVYSPYAPQGDEFVTVENCVLHSGATASGVGPVGVLLATGSSSQGLSGQTLIKNVAVRGNFVTGITNTYNESLVNIGSAWTNIIVEDCELSSCATPYILANTYSVKNTRGVNPTTGVVAGVAGTHTAALDETTIATGGIQWTWTLPPATAKGTAKLVNNTAYNLYATASAGVSLYTVASTPTVYVGGVGKLTVPTGTAYSFESDGTSWYASQNTPTAPSARLVYNVKDYGAAVDGTTDDSAAIQSTLTAILTTGVSLTPVSVTQAVPTKLASMTFSGPSNPYSIYPGQTISGAGTNGYGIVDTATVSGGNLTITISGNIGTITTTPYLISFGGEMYVPAGVCVTQPFTLPSNVIISGAGSQFSKLQMKAASNTDFITTMNFAANLGVSVNGMTGYGYRNISIDANALGQTVPAGGNANLLSRCFVSYGYSYINNDVQFINGYSGGVYTSWTNTKGVNSMESLWDCVKIFNYGRGGAATGLEFHGPHDTQIDHSIIASLDSNIKGWATTNASGYSLAYGALPVNAGTVPTATISASGAANTSFTFTCSTAISSSYFPTTGGAFMVQLVSLNSTTPSPTWALIQYTGIGTVSVANDTFTGCSCTLVTNGTGGYAVRAESGISNIAFPTYGLNHQDFSQVATPTAVTANSTPTTITTVVSGGTSIGNWTAASPGSLQFAGNATSFPISAGGYGVVNILVSSGVASCAYTGATGTGTVTLTGLIPLNGNGGTITTGTSTIQAASSMTFPTYTASATTTTTSTLANVTISTTANYLQGQSVYLSGFTNGIPNGWYTVVSLVAGSSITVSNVPGPIAASGTGTISPGFGPALGSAPLYGTVTGQIAGLQNVTGAGLTSTTVAWLDPVANICYLAPSTLAGATPTVSQYQFYSNYSAGGLQTNTLHIWGRNHIGGYLGQAWWGSNNEWEGAFSVNAVFDAVNLGWNGGTIYGNGGSLQGTNSTHEIGLELGHNNLIRTCTFSGTIYQINRYGAAILSYRTSGLNNITATGDSNNPLYYVQTPFTADNYTINTRSFTQTNLNNISQTTTIQGGLALAAGLNQGVTTFTGQYYLLGGFNCTLTTPATNASGQTLTFTLTNASATWPAGMWANLGTVSFAGFGSIYNNTAITVVSATANSVSITSTAGQIILTSTTSTGVVYFVPVAGNVDWPTVVFNPSAAGTVCYVGQPTGAAVSPTYQSVGGTSKQYQIINATTTAGRTIALTPADLSGQNTCNVNGATTALTIPIINTAQSGATPGSSFRLISGIYSWYTC